MTKEKKITRFKQRDSVWLNLHGARQGQRLAPVQMETVAPRGNIDIDWRRDRELAPIFLTHSPASGPCSQPVQCDIHLRSVHT